MKQNDPWYSETKNVKKKWVFYSPDNGEVEILESSEDYVEKYHKTGEKVVKHLAEGTRKSRATRQPKDVDDKIAELLRENPEANATELFDSFPSPYEAYDDEPYREEEYIHYFSSPTRGPRQEKEMGREAFRKRVRKVKKEQEI